MPFDTGLTARSWLKNKAVVPSSNTEGTIGMSTTSAIRTSASTRLERMPAGESTISRAVPFGTSSQSWLQSTPITGTAPAGRA